MMINKNVSQQKIALIAGTINEIGMTIARRLASRNVMIVLCDKHGEQLSTARSQLADAGVPVTAVALADTTGSQIQAAVEQVLSTTGRIDILVNRGLHLEGKPLSEMSATDFFDAIDATIGIQFNFLHGIIPNMRYNNYGRVINFSSLAYLGSVRGLNIAAAQAGLFGLTRSLALEAAQDNVTVNTIVEGDLQQAGMAEEKALALANSIPVKRLATPGDVANAVAFFASRDAQYVTGQTFFVCGGKSAYYSMSV